MNNELGIFIKEQIKRYVDQNNKKKIDVIKELNITAQYLNDIENGKRIPSADLMKKIIEILKLSDSDKIKMYDYASDSHKTKRIPVDIEEFILTNKDAKKRIRKLILEMGEK